MAYRRLLRALLLTTLAFATAWGSSAGLVATVTTVTFVAAGCGPSASEEEPTGPQQSLEEIAHLVESALEDGKADSPERPTILGDLVPNLRQTGRFVPSKRFLAWSFVGDTETPIQLDALLRSSRPSSLSFLLLLWRPGCDQPWRVVTTAERTLATPLPTDGDFLAVTGPRSPRASGSVEILLTLGSEVTSGIRPSICPPGGFDRPPVPFPLDPPPTAAVGTLPGSFQVNAAGGANYRVSLAVPPGRANVAPSLAVSYSSGGPNGLLGIGFQLEGFSSIERCAKDLRRDGVKDRPHYTADDPMCLDGVRIRGDRLERDDLRRITGTADGFRVYAKDGTVFDYGALVYGVRQSVGQIPIRAWQLSRVSDRAGNFYTLEYENTPGPDGETVESRPRRIVYTGWTDGSEVRPGNREIVFEYPRSNRDDEFHGYALGGQIQRTKLLSRINVLGPDRTATWASTRKQLLTSYSLDYGKDGGNGLSRLEKITECAGETTTVCKPPTTFKWEDMRPGVAGGVGVPAHTPFDPGRETWGTRNPANVGNYRAPTPFLNVAARSVMAIDLNGDGRSDILYPTINASDPKGSWHVLVSTTLPTGELSFQDVDTHLHDRAVTPFDVDGDGRTDLLLHDDSLDEGRSTWQYVLSTGNGYTDPQQARGDVTDRRVFRTQTLNEKFILSEDVTRILDRDGDGKQEILICNPRGAWVELFPPADRRSYPTPTGRCDTQDPLVIDLFGTGRTDLLIPKEPRPGENPDPVFPGTNLRRSQLTRPRSASDDPGQLRPFTRVGDFNGDGLADIIGTGLAEDLTFSRVFFNRGDGTFVAGDLSTVRGGLDSPTDSVVDSDGDGISEIVSDTAASTIGDFDGDGLADHLSGWGISFAAARGMAPMHVTEIRNGLVSQTLGSAPTVRIGYEPMVLPSVYTPTSEQCVRPMRCHKTGKLLVREVTSDAGKGQTAREQHSYEDARSDRDGYGWFGFRKRTVLDRQRCLVPSDPTTCARVVTEFHNTDVQHAGLARTSVATTPLELPGPPPRDVGRPHVSHTENTWTVSGTTQSYFPVLSSSTTTEDDGVLIRTVTTSQDVNAFGCTTHSTVGFGDGYVLERKVLEWAPVSVERDAVLCLPRLSETRSRQPLEGGATDEKVRTSLTEYDPTTFLPAKLTREPPASGAISDPTLWLEHTIGRDAFGNVTSIRERTAAGERRTTAAYEPQGYFPLRVTNALGHTTEVRHDPAWGHLLVRQDPNGVSSLWAYDAFGWLHTERHSYRTASVAENDVTTHTLALRPDPAVPGYTVQTTTTGGGDATSTFDSLGRAERTCRTILPAAGTPGARYACADVDYNDRGLVSRQSRPHRPEDAPAFFTTFGYDLLGRSTSVTHPNGEVETTTYAGRVASTTHANPQQSVTRTEINQRGQVTTSTSGFGSPRQSAASYAYGAFGDLRRIDRAGTDASVSTRITTDAYGRRTLLDDPDTGCTKNEWTAFDELDTVRDRFDSEQCKDDRDARSTRFIRDDLGRITRRLDADGEARWTFDTARYGLGKLAFSQSAPQAPSGAVHTETRTYDALSRPQAEATQLDLRGGGDLGLYITGRTYDDFGRVSAIGYPSSLLMGGLRIEHQYDDTTGDLRAVYRGLPGGRRGARLWNADSVGLDGQLTRETFGNGLPTTRTYDPATGRQDTIVTGTHYPNVVQDLHYQYHPGGNLKSRESRTDAAVTQTEVFEYDELDRVTTASTNGRQTLAVDYDALGNIRSKSDVGIYAYQAPARAGLFKAHAVSQAGAVALFYDAAGLLTKRQDAAARIDQTIDYTAFGKPRRMSAAGADPETFFEYDADGERVVRRSDKRRTISVGGLYQWTNITGAREAGEPGQSHRYFVYAAGRVVAEISRTIEASSLPLFPLAKEQTRYLHDDHLGSTHVITDQDGHRVATMSYDAFGLRRDPADWAARPAAAPKPTGLPVAFTGHEEDPFGLINMKGRIYDPKLGRFLQPDPIVQAPHFTQSLNRYSYVWNNPLRMTDPSGFETDDGGGAPTPQVDNAQLCSTGWEACELGGPIQDVDLPDLPSDGSNGGPSHVITIANGEIEPDLVPPTRSEIALAKRPNGITPDHGGGGGDDGNRHAGWMFVPDGQKTWKRPPRNFSGGEYLLPVLPSAAEMNDAIEDGRWWAAGWHAGWVVADFATFGGAGKVKALIAGSSTVAKIAIQEIKAAVSEGKAVAAEVEAGAESVKSNIGRARDQERLRQLGRDPKASSSDRGWIKQEEHQIARGTRERIRRPPGRELAHTRGREAAKGYDHMESPSNLQDKDLHSNQHKFDDFGRKQPEQVR